ncbi:hypothetical protein P280DRAFT_407354 [Massarina eburnea CBS 473.64]|uniref:PCI domain-containing protein n=1 Tax=Massarina eburnea CBS 473.64 TaxID=1395130 RepID=A0A6A6RQ55_9PLEO|nr:hypothetical protein P280DRAFT_407354 [Massarina eburnea CBS 473.64]
MAFPTSTVAWSQSPLQHPAYNSVAARTTLHRPASVQASVGFPRAEGLVLASLNRAQTEPSPSPEKPKSFPWSDAVREYVGRAFESQNVIESISNEEMTIKLRSVISFFAERGQLESVDWPTHPLPQEIIRDERAAKRGKATMSSSNGFTNSKLDFPQAKKRKPQDADEQQAGASIPPWRKANLEARITYTPGTEKRHKKNALLRDPPSKFDPTDLEKRKQRFNLDNNGNNKPAPPWGSPRQDSDSDMNTALCVGTNQSLEKSYFRLTAPPKPETVRPQHVLEKTLQMLTRKWKEEKNYGYICNQFKSLRQDLTVQHIKNAFTVKAYELHARIALEKGDLGEYNQCQTQLKELYEQNLPGNAAEFTAYRILYIVYTCNKVDMNDVLAELTAADKVQPWIKHALDVRSSVACGNYHKFFQLYLNTPNMGSYLIDMFVERERLHALANISKAYMTVALRFLTDELSFDNDDACCEFLTSIGAQHLLDSKIDQTGNRQIRIKTREGAALFEGLRKTAFRVVDIKGQI